MSHRIAYFGSSTAMDGGSELCLLRMAKHFSKIHEVTLFLPDEGPLFQAASENGIHTVNLDFLRLRRFRGFDWLRWARSLTRARNRLRRELQQRRIELVHFNDLIDLPYASAPASLGIPSLSHLRLILRNPLAKAIYRVGVLRSRTRVLCVSEAVQKEMIGDETRILNSVLYDPAPDPELFHPCDNTTSTERTKLRNQWGWEEDNFGVIMVSKLLPKKGHLNFLRVANRLEATSPGRFAYCLVAGPTPGREVFEREVLSGFDRLPKGRRQWIRGIPNRDLPKYLRACDLFLHLPDTPDSFPGVVLEAMACGLPVVAHRVGGIPEQLGNGACGLLVSPGDLDGTIRAIERLADDAAERDGTIRKAHLQLRERFSSDRHFRDLEEIYTEVLRSEGPPSR